MNIDEAIAKAKPIIEEIYKREFASITSRSAPFHIRSTRTEDLEHIAGRKENATKTFAGYLKHIETLVLKVGKPVINKKERYGCWSIEKDRLFVCPVVRFKSAVCEGKVVHIWEFRTRGDAGEPRSVPSAGFHDHVSSLYVHHIPADLHPLILEVCGTKLDALDRQIQEVEADVQSKLDEILAAHKGKYSGKESKKFQAKLMKFMKAFPFFADSSAQFVMDCFQIDHENLEGLQKFLKANRADINFVTVEDIEEARQLAQIAEVHDG